MICIYYSYIYKGKVLFDCKDRNKSLICCIILQLFVLLRDFCTIKESKTFIHGKNKYNMEEEFEQEQKSQGGGGMVEVAPYYESRVENFVSMYETCDIEEAEEFFDDVKLRDFFGCESREFMRDGLPSYREQLIKEGYKEVPLPWLGGKMCFPVRMRWTEAV